MLQLKKTDFYILALLAGFLAWARPCIAKPMAPASMEEGIKVSTVVVAEFLGYDSGGKPDYFGGIATSYRVKRVLAKEPGSLTKKRIAPGRVIKVR